MSKYGHKTVNWLEAIVNKLGGEEKAEAFLRGEIEIVPKDVAEIGRHYWNLQGYDGVPIFSKQSSFPVWKCIRLGQFSSALEYRMALAANGVKLEAYANRILNTIQISTEQVDLDLVLLTPTDLGFVEFPKYKEFCEKALELGYGFCPAEVGPALRLEYRDQGVNESIQIAMEPIKLPRGGTRNFWLSGYENSLSAEWCLRQVSSKCVFVAPRK